MRPVDPNGGWPRAAETAHPIRPDTRSLTSCTLVTPTEVPRMTRSRPNSPQYPTPAQRRGSKCRHTARMSL